MRAAGPAATAAAPAEAASQSAIVGQAPRLEDPLLAVIEHVEGRDQVWIAQGKSDPHPRQRIRLREGPQDEEIPVPREQADARLRREIDVSLIEHDDAARSRDDVLHRRLSRPRAGRRVGVDYELEGCMVSGEPFRPDPALRARIRHRDRFMDRAQWLEQRIRRRRVGDVVALAGECPEAHLDKLIATVAQGHLRRPQVEVGGDCSPGGCGGRAGVQAQRIPGSGLDRLDDLGRRRQRRFVGVQLDPVFAIRRLVAGDVGFEARKGFLQEAFRHLRRSTCLEKKTLEGETRTHVLLQVAQGVVGELDQPCPPALLCAVARKHSPPQLDPPAGDCEQRRIFMIALASPPCHLAPIQLGRHLQRNVGRSAEHLFKPACPLAVQLDDAVVTRNAQSPTGPASS